MAENVEIAPAAPRTLLWMSCGITLVAAAGCLGIFHELFLLWIAWTTDPLRSIGMLIPPVSIVLTLRVWRQHDWEMQGTWWGLPVIGLAYLLSVLREKVVLLAVFGRAAVSFIPLSLPVYVYGSGLILLFAGVRVWRKAWFPLGLLLLCQPVPGMTNGLIDIPLQNLSARVARSFATLIHFAPTTPQLRLMFSPDFGMFIAPGCDGIRGAVTMGYVALILGYLKRFSWYRWLAYVVGALLLGYLFNFIRLCVLVVYYRVALGHPALEGVAKQADYAIGSCLFLVATFLFLSLARRDPGSAMPEQAEVRSDDYQQKMGSVARKCAALAVVLLAALALPSSPLRASKAITAVSTDSLAARMPKQVGEFVLTRTWYEQQAGITAEEDGAYAAPGSDEVILGIWVGRNSSFHDTTWCWLARGLHPDVLTTGQFATADGKSLALSTGFYSDGVTDSIVVDAICTPGSCTQFHQTGSDTHVGLVFLEPGMGDLGNKGEHPVSIMVRVDKLHSNTPKSENYDLLAAEARRFLSGLDPIALSRAFQ